MRRTAGGLLAAATFLLAAQVSHGRAQAPPIDVGMLSGTVRFDGPLPQPMKMNIGKDKNVCAARTHFDRSLVVGPNRGIANAVVAITDIKTSTPVKPQSSLKMDQRECQYEPHVLAFMAGSTVAVLNSDGILHDIHTYPKNNPGINFAQPGFKKVINVRVKKPDIIKITCDAHGWMEGWWYAAANPYFAITDTDGHFKISDVPPGVYTVKVWQEKLAPSGHELSRRVSIKPKDATNVDFTLKAGGRES